MQDKLHQIQQQSLEKIDQADSLKSLDEIFLEVFGKNGVVTLISKDLPKVPKQELPIVGPLFNQIKKEIEQAVSVKREGIREEIYQKLENETFDLNPNSESKNRTGHLHPITVFENEIAKLFGKMGFQQFNAPQIDTDHNNFEVLNIPEEHPARDMWDTFYLQGESPSTSLGVNSSQGKGASLLLRTHTSNSQIRIMQEHELPIRMMILGRCFRYENIDARHEHTFEQFELVYIDKGLSMANLQYLSEVFFKAVLGTDIKARLRPKYYPFVEPGVGVDALCMFCKGAGCKVCSGVGWLELAGAGMMHPNVLKNGGIDPNVYSGIAWGFGPERMVMLKQGVEDMRQFKNGDLKFLQRIGGSVKRKG